MSYSFEIKRGAVAVDSQNKNVHVLKTTRQARAMGPCHTSNRNDQNSTYLGHP